MPTSEIFNTDCLAAMREMPDKCFELAIVDPPYGLGNRLSDGGGKLKNTPMSVLYRNSSKWDNSTPDEAYFTELFRVSKNQIVWGGNYFNLPPSRCMICWDKKQDMPTLSAWELGWTSFDKPSKIFQLASTDLNRIHPTQKPIALYKWLLKNYANPGDRILDTHLGSGSSRIAAYDMGFDFVGYELDTEYFEASDRRFKNHISNLQMFTPEEMYQNEQKKLF